MPHAKHRDYNCDVVVIGGGLSGLLAAHHLIFTTEENVQIVWIERGPTWGPGLAYSTKSPAHLLNVRAGTLGAFPEDPNGFLRWLQLSRAAAGKGPLDPAGFRPRSEYAAYLESMAEPLLRQSVQREPLKAISAEATAVRRGPKGWTVELSSEERINASHVILATGNAAPTLPTSLIPEFSKIDTRFIGNPWKNEVLKTISADEKVLLLGTGLTMIDTALFLDEANHKGALFALSRHGLIPEPHAPPEAAIRLAFDRDERVTARRLLVRTREAIESATSQGKDWRTVIDALRAHTPSLWRALSDVEKRRFLRHARAYWDTHRHRAPEVARKRIDKLQRDGLLEVAAGRIKSLNPKKDQIEVVYTPRGATTPKSLFVNRIINCTGPSLDYSRSSNPLIQSLQIEGLITPHPSGIGVRTTFEGELIGQNGSPVGGIFTLGALRIGELWESTAVAEIRRQAEALALALAERLTEVKEAA